MAENKKMTMISVIMPAYNEEKYIEKALDSVCTQEGDFSIEILVIDDNSTDATKNIVLDMACRISTRENNLNNGVSVRLLTSGRSMGVAEARNLGIKKAKGEYIAFLDADDWWKEGKLKKQIAFMKENNLSFTATGRELMNADGSTTGKVIPIPEKITYKMMLRTNYIPCSSVVMKKELAEEFYMCHDELHEDYIMWMEILRKYNRVYGIDVPFLCSRLSENGKSRNKFKSAKMLIGCYRYLGYGLIKTAFYFCAYTYNGFKKYGK